MTTPIRGITELADGQQDQFITANEAFRALEQADTQLLLRAITGTSYTLVSLDRGRLVTMNNGAANTLTVPPDSSVAFPVGTLVYVLQLGAGQTTIVAGSGVTINTTETLVARGQYAMLALVKIATDTWVLAGEREAA